MQKEYNYIIGYINLGDNIIKKLRLGFRDMYCLFP